MIAIKLNSQQTSTLQAHVTHLKTYLQTKESRNDPKDQVGRVAFLHETLAARLPQLSEADVTELVATLREHSLRLK